MTENTEPNGTETQLDKLKLWIHQTKLNWTKHWKYRLCFDSWHLHPYAIIIIHYQSHRILLYCIVLYCTLRLLCIDLFFFGCRLFMTIALSHPWSRACEWKAFIKNFIIVTHHLWMCVCVCARVCEKEWVSVFAALLHTDSAQLIAVSSLHIVLVAWPLSVFIYCHCFTVCLSFWLHW